MSAAARRRIFAPSRLDRASLKNQSVNPIGLPQLLTAVISLTSCDRYAEQTVKTGTL